MSGEDSKIRGTCSGVHNVRTSVFGGGLYWGPPFMETLLGFIWGPVQYAPPSMGKCQLMDLGLSAKLFPFVAHFLQGFT